MRMKRFFLALLVSALAAGGAMAVVVVALGRGTDLEARLLLTALALGGFSVTGLASGIWVDRRRFRLLGVVGVLVSAVALAYCALLVWGTIPAAGIPEGFPREKVALGLIVAAAGLAHISLLLLAEGRHRPVDAVVWLTVVAVAALAVMVGVSIALDLEPRGNFGRATAVLAIVAALGTIVAPVLRRLLGMGAIQARGRHRPGGATPPV